jgi:hypothetical protein
MLLSSRNAAPGSLSFMVSMQVLSSSHFVQTVPLSTIKARLVNEKVPQAPSAVAQSAENECRTKGDTHFSSSFTKAVIVVLSPLASFCTASIVGILSPRSSMPM